MRDAFLVLNFCLHVLNGVVWFNVQRDGLSSERLDEDLHGTTAKTKDKVKGRSLLDVVIGKGSAIFELLSRENQTLLFRWNSFLILDFCLHILNGVIWLDVQGDCLSRERLDEDLHSTTAKTKNKVKGRLLLNVVVREGSAIFELLSREDETLLLRRDAFLVLDFGLHVLNGVIWLDVQRNGL